MLQGRRYTCSTEVNIKPNQSNFCPWEVWTKWFFCSKNVYIFCLLPKLDEFCAMNVCWNCETLSRRGLDFEFLHQGHPCIKWLLWGSMLIEQTIDNSLKHKIIFILNHFLEKYAHTIMVTVLVTMLGDCCGSFLSSLSQVCLVQDTWQLANFSLGLQWNSLIARYKFFISKFYLQQCVWAWWPAE